MQVKSTRDNGERYPTPVAAFEVWFANRCREAATAETGAALDAAVNAVRDYANAQWCFPDRLTKIEGIARKRWNELNRGNDRKMHAAGDA